MGSNPSILLLDKKPDITSFSALRETKNCIGRRVGHVGTLDRFASGLLVVLTGRMTRLGALFTGLDKTYEARFVFGKQTDTLDKDGQVIATGGSIDPSKLDAVITSRFLGPVMQEPPVFSALHVHGERASKMVRSGKEVVMRQRPVTIHSFKVLEAGPDFLHAVITVSKGTYIRSIARDLALALGSRGYVEYLRRLSIGPFSVDEAVGCDDKEAIMDSLSKTEEYLLRLPEVGRFTIPSEDGKLMMHGRLSGNLLPLDEESRQVRYAAVYLEGRLLWIVDRSVGKILVQMEDVDERC